MTTAEKLEGMSDPGQFEILALRALRELEEDCRSVVHLGINAVGKTIPNPIDGFCLVPRSQPHRYIMTAFTISQTDGLQRKWLYDHKTASDSKDTGKVGKGTTWNDGDLIKAARNADLIRKRDQGASFVVYLCTNRIPSPEVMRSVYAKADELRIEARFLDQSRLRDFLDSKPEGQWLRQEHLGIEADQVSRSLLQQLSRTILAEYSAQILLTAPDSIVRTSAAQTAHDGIRSASSTLYILSGASGVGKSVIGYDLLRRHIEGGGIGVWMRREIAERATTLAEAIEEALRSSHPKLEKGAGQTTIKLARADDPLLLVVDDINRSPAAALLLQKILGWSRLASEPDQNGQKPKSPIRIVCPVWDSNWLAVRTLYESNDWLRVQTVGPLLRSESIECLRATLGGLAVGFNEVELNQFAEALKDDAILLGLFGQVLKREPKKNPMALTQDVISHMVEGAVGEIAANNGGPGAQYTSALKQLAKEMVHRKSLYPRWTELEAWFEAKQQTLIVLERIVTQGAVCRVLKRDGHDQFEFRHDRILEYHLQQAIAEMLAQEGGIPDGVWDPFFTAELGKIVAGGDLPSLVLDLVSEKNPVALISAIEYLPPDHSEYVGQIVMKAHKWLRGVQNALDSVRDDAYNLLATIHSPHVLLITQDLEEHRLLSLARLRNGDPVAGARALSRDFYPSTNYAWLEALIHQAQMHHGSQLMSGLKLLLTSKDLDHRLRTGALILAGYLGDSSLAEAVKLAWENSGDQLGTLLEALWASLRCSDNAPDKFLQPIVRSVLRLEDKEPAGRLPQRQELLQEISFATRHGVKEPVLRYLAELGRIEEYRWVVTAILNRIDHPVATEYVVGQLAFVSHQAEQRGGFHPFAFAWGDVWRRRKDEGGLPPSPASLAVLRSLWEGATHPDWLKKYALSVWTRIADDICALQSIPATSPLHDTALWHRGLKGDRTVVPEIIQRLKDQAKWLHVVSEIWCQEFEESLDLWLRKAATDQNPWSNLEFELAHVLRDIPRTDAQRLLFKHWGNLGRKPLFIQAALYLATDESQARAAESIHASDADEGLFQYISHFFGFMTSGLVDKLSARHLESLRPYLPSLDEICICDMLEFCRRHGYWQWALRALQPECLRRIHSGNIQGEKRSDMILHAAKEYFPTDHDLIADLDEIEKEEVRSRSGALWFWSEAFLKRGDSLDRLFSVVEQWLRNSPSVGRYRIAATLIQYRGSRSHLRVLQSCTSIQQTPESHSLLANVRYAVCRRSLD